VEAQDPLKVGNMKILYEQVKKADKIISY